MKTITSYICDICNATYDSPELAQTCEQSASPPKRCEIGQEIKLKNRNIGHTVAIVKGMRLVQNYYTTPPWKGRVGEFIAHVAKLKDYFWHEWEIELDRDVMLDHHWETALNFIPDFYLLNEDDPKAKIRDDNNCY